MSTSDFNAPDSDWIEFAISAALTLASVLLGGAVRTLSRGVQHLDGERQLIRRRCANNGHILFGEYSLFALLGAPHLLRTRSLLSFATLLAVVVATTALALSATAFSGSRRLRVGQPSVKVTAMPGDPLSDEDAIAKFADWFRSSGVVSMCQRRAGASRIYFQPFVELGPSIRAFCGKPLPVRIAHEEEESIEAVNPTTLTVDTVAGVTTSTPHSQFVSHDFNVLGNGLRAVCNTGEFYRTVRSGRVGQTCAFTTKTSLILGGYHTNQTNLAGPGQMPVRDDIIYFDSYTIGLQTELSQLQLMQALTLWDLGTMSEVEVAVLATLRLEKVTGVPSFLGGFERLQIDVPLLAAGLSVALACIVAMIIAMLWHHFVTSPAEHLRVDLADLNALSRMQHKEIVKGIPCATGDGEPYSLALRDVTECTCSKDEHHRRDCNFAVDAREFHLGSALIGRPTHPNDRVADIIKKVQPVGRF